MDDKNSIKYDADLFVSKEFFVAQMNALYSSIDSWKKRWLTGLLLADLAAVAAIIIAIGGLTWTS